MCELKNVMLEHLYHQPAINPEELYATLLEYRDMAVSYTHLLAEIDGNAAMDTLKEKGALTFDFGGEEVVLTEEDLLIDTAQMEGYVSEGDNAVTVVLDTNLTPELIEEGFVRELVSKIQTMRKEADFEVTNHINIYQDTNDRIAEIIKAHACLLYTSRCV